MSDCLLRGRSARGRGQSAIYLKTVCPVLSGYSEPGFFYYILFCPLGPTTVKYLTLSLPFPPPPRLKLSRTRSRRRPGHLRPPFVDPFYMDLPNHVPHLCRTSMSLARAFPGRNRRPYRRPPWECSPSSAPSRRSTSPPPKSIMGMDSW